MIGGKISQSKKRPLRKNIKADHLSLVSLRLFYFIYFFYVCFWSVISAFGVQSSPVRDPLQYMSI